MTMGGGRGTGYWKARAGALEAANRRLHERLLALASLLPPEYMDDLEAESPPGGALRHAPPVPGPGEDSPRGTPAEVERDLRNLWTRTGPPGEA